MLSASGPIGPALLGATAAAAVACQTAPGSAKVEAEAEAEAARGAPADSAHAPEVIDVHLHLTETEHVGAILAAMDRHGIARAVVMASPHLSVSEFRPGLERYADANRRVLEAAKAHPGRLLPFVTVNLGVTEVAEAEALLDDGACGLKLYQGHRALRDRPLDDPAHLALFEMLERRRVPVLLHVNTFRFRDELVRLARRFPRLPLVCPHLCGSRTDLDRLEGLLDELPNLLVDTSHGPGQPGIDGYVSLDAAGARLRERIVREPHRFLFGSDLVANLLADAQLADWDLQIAANLGLVTRERFRFWGGEAAARRLREYRGLALPAEIAAQVLGGNARRWLARCLPASDAGARGASAAQ